MASVAELRAFALRDRSAVADAKTAYWVAWKRKHGAAGAIAMADMLRRQVKAARPDWPSSQERREDLRIHARVSAMLRRVPARGR